MSNKPDSNIYRIITRAAALFGGVQVVSIVCSVIRTKLIAVWLGSTGVGIIALYNTTIETVTALTGLGIRSSSVREISDAGTSGVKERLSQVITVVKRWSVLVGLLGAAVMITAAPLLSRLTFGDEKHIWGFVALSCVIFFNAIMSGEQAILQGTRQLKRLARCSIYGAVAALATSVPLYYWGGIDGIVPALIVYAAVTCLATWLLRNKDIPTTHISVRQTLHSGKDMVTLGIFMTVSSFITTLFSYLFSAYLNYKSGESMVGYYQAGYALMNKYVGLIFSAMAMEYYPRLAGVSHDTSHMSRYVGQQNEMMQLILLPVIALFIVLHPLMVRLLYSAEFYTINGYLLPAIQGIPFKAISWSIGFVLLAKGDGKLYFITELLSDSITFALNIVGYEYWGLAGVGASYTIGFILYLIIIYAVCRHKYAIKPGRASWSITGITVACSALIYALYTVSPALAWIPTVPAVIVSVIALRRKWTRPTDEAQ